MDIRFDKRGFFCYAIGMIPRTLSAKLKKLASKFPVLAVTGPRQSGKTVLARMTFPGYSYVSLENPETRDFALNDPKGFLGKYDKKVIIDEVQRVPGLFSYIQGIVDADPFRGRYVLTGSQQFHLLNKIGQTLPGRCAYTRLLPFSLAELQKRSFKDPFSFPGTGKNAKKSGFSLKNLLFTGMYPPIHDRKIAPGDFFSGYVAQYVERDIREILNVGDLTAFGNFLRLCAGRSGQLLNLSSLASDCGISHTTAGRWLSLLETCGIIFLLRPFYKNFSKRIVKSPKLYFYDTGLVCYLLRIRNTADLAGHPLYGSVFETFAVSELYKSFVHRGEESPLYFWRDKTGNEIDFLFDVKNAVAGEIKAGETVSSVFFKNLLYFNRINSDKARLCLVYGGEESYAREGVNILSWKDLP